jgi:hypothetical protein
MQALAVAAEHDQPTMRDSRDAPAGGVIHDASSDAGELAVLTGGPDLRAEEAQAHGDETVMEMPQHDIVALMRRGGIEH